jgi:hypothetical protein
MSVKLAMYMPIVSDFPFILKILPAFFYRIFFFCNNIGYYQAYLNFQSQTRSKEKCTYFTVAR